MAPSKSRSQAKNKKSIERRGAKRPSKANSISSSENSDTGTFKSPKKKSFVSERLQSTSSEVMTSDASSRNKRPQKKDAQNKSRKPLSAISKAESDTVDVTPPHDLRSKPTISHQELKEKLNPVEKGLQLKKRQRTKTPKVNIPLAHRVATPGSQHLPLPLKPNEVIHGRKWSAFVGYSALDINFFIYHKHMIDMKPVKLEAWWKANIDTNKPDRLRIHKLKLKTQSTAEQIQIFARIEDTVDDLRVKKIIKELLLPALHKILRSEDHDGMEMDEPLIDLIQRFQWQIADHYTYDEYPRRSARATGRGAPPPPTDTDSSIFKKVLELRKIGKSGEKLYKVQDGRAISEQGNYESSDDEDESSNSVSSEDAISKESEARFWNERKSPSGSDEQTSDPEQENLQSKLEPNKNASYFTDENSDDDDETEELPEVDEILVLQQGTLDGAGLKGQVLNRNGSGSEILNEASESEENEADGVHKHSQQQDQYRINNAYPLPRNKFPGTRYGTVMTENEMQQWKNLEARQESSGFGTGCLYCKAVAEQQHYILKIFTRVLNLIKDVKEIKSAVAIIEETLATFTSMHNETHKNESSVSIFKPRCSSRLPLTSWENMVAFFDEAEANPALLEELGSHLVFHIEQNRRRGHEGRLNMSTWAKFLLTNLFDTDNILKKATWGFINANTSRRPLPKVFRDWYMNEFQHKYMAKRFDWYRPSQFAQKVGNYFGNIRKRGE